MKLSLGLAALTLGVGSLATVPAFAQTLTVGVRAPQPTVVVAAPAPAPVYVRPAPTYVAPAPAPVYVAPAPVYAAPAPVYAAPAPQYVGQDWATRRATIQFIANTRARMGQMDGSLRAGVSRGRIDARAIAAFDGERAHIEAVLGRASRDGVIVAHEQRRIEVMLGSMANLEAQYRLPASRWGRFHAWR